MSARRPTPRRPPLSAPRGQLRAAYRLAGGMSPAKVARAEAVAEREIDALLAQPDFQELLPALAEMEELPEAERLRRLERHGLARARAGAGRRRLAGRRLHRRPDAPGLQPRPLAGPGRDRRPGPRRRRDATPAPSGRAGPAPTTPSTPPSAAPPPACARSWAWRPPWRICRSRRRPSRSRPRPRPSRRPQRCRAGLTPWPPGSAPAPPSARQLPKTTRATSCAPGRRGRDTGAVPDAGARAHRRRGCC